jgi:hypothetical protein
MATAPDPFVVDFPTLFVALDWTEHHCVIPDGFRQGEPFELIDWQAWCLANFYRVKPTALWVPSNPILAPAFYYRRSQIVLPQKAGKGPYTAAHVCLEGVGPALFAGWAKGGEVYDCRHHGCGCGWIYEYEPGEPMGMPWPTPLIQITAFSEEQTDNVYDALRPMIEKGPLSEVIPRTGEEFIRLPNGGRIDTVTSSAQSRLGQRVTFVPQDEVGIWTVSNKMDKVASTQRRGLSGMGGRAEETTNAYDPAENSVAQQTAESTSKDVFRYHPQAPKHLSYRNKRERAQIHRYVYGNSLRERGGHIDLDAIEAEAAEIAEKDPAQAERFYGNRCTSGTGSWLKDGLWDSRGRRALGLPPRIVPAKTKICLGFDGSDTGDWTAIRAETLDGFQFTPTFGPDDQPTIWDPTKFSSEIPRLEVAAALDHLMSTYRVLRMYCDVREWKTEIEGWQLQYGEKRVIKWETNRPVQMHESLKRFVADLPLVITHDDCKVTGIHVGNARRVAKPGERYGLGKPSEHQKIDLAVCSVLAHEARSDARLAGATDDDTSQRRVVVSSRR